jgi:hypothetical protein
MKKSLLKVFIVLIAITFIIAWLNIDLKKESPNEISPILSWESKHIDNIIKKDEKSLNWWLSLYNSWLFKKIEIEDWVTLKWYILSGSEEKDTIFPLWWKKTVDNYFLITTKKPTDTSIIELWLNLTWDTTIKTIYNEESIFIRPHEFFREGRVQGAFCKGRDIATRKRLPSR